MNKKTKDAIDRYHYSQKRNDHMIRKAGLLS